MTEFRFGVNYPFKTKWTLRELLLLVILGILALEMSGEQQTSQRRSFKWKDGSDTLDMPNMVKKRLERQTS